MVAKQSPEQSPVPPEPLQCLRHARFLEDCRATLGPGLAAYFKAAKLLPG